MHILKEARVPLRDLLGKIYILRICDWVLLVTRLTSSESPSLGSKANHLTLNYIFYRLFFYITPKWYIRGFNYLIWLVKNLPAMQETQVWPLVQEDPLEEGMATHASILAWWMPWREESGRLQPIKQQRVELKWFSMHTHRHKQTEVYHYSNAKE